MKLFSVLLLAGFFGSISMFGGNVSALSVSAPPLSAPQAPPSPLIVTALSGGAYGVDFIQLYNNSDTVFPLHGTTVLIMASNDTEEMEVELAELDGWILPKGYIVVSAAGAVKGADMYFSLNNVTPDQLQTMTSLNIAIIAGASYQSHFVDVTGLSAVHPAVPWLKRATKGSKYVVENKLTDFLGATDTDQLYGGGLYYPPDSIEGLYIVEVLANAENCSPTEQNLTCKDYIKLFNANDKPVSLEHYRLRTDSGGNKSTTSNTFSLTGEIAPGGYATIYQRDNDEDIAITNTGGYVWLEDAQGVQIYDPVINYPDASATSKKGLSWAYNSATNSWDWMTPAPDRANYWPPVNQQSAPIINSNLADCGPGRERNPATNRCRNIVSATNMLTPCKEGQERNPETNRCRSVLGASTTLKPCEPGEVRNPETNRCRKVASAASSLAPCKPGQERNPETNRCRKAAGVTQLNQVEDVESGTSASTTSWWVTGGIVLLALSYIIYEWRQEIFLRLRR